MFTIGQNGKETLKNPSLPGSDLLDALDDEARALIAPDLEALYLKSGHIIQEPGSIVRHSYFPRNDALVAFLIPMEDGETMECAMVGREGVVGGVIGPGHLPAYARSCVHNGGDFFRISVAKLAEVRARSRTIDDLLNRYSDYIVAQLFQSIVCNARHSIEQRAARWLCAAVSRTGSMDVMLTQAQLGGFLGVGRSYLTRILARFKAQGILATRRGAIIVRQPARLHAMSCDCGGLIAEHFKLVMR